MIKRYSDMLLETALIKVIPLGNDNRPLPLGSDLGKICINFKTDISTDMFAHFSNPASQICQTLAASIFEYVGELAAREGRWNTELPVLNLGSRLALMQAKKLGLSDELVINPPVKRKAANDKIEYAKLMQDLICLPKTVFTKEDAIKKLEFPVIAKPKSGRSGMGITRFITPEELEKSEDYFDLYCEAIKIKKEFRFVYWKDTLIFWAEREAKDDKSKFLKGEQDTAGKKSKDDKLEFIYHIKTPEELSDLDGVEDLTRVAKELRNKLKLDYVALDLAQDEDGKWWTIEANSCPATPANILPDLYVHMFKSIYGRMPDDNTLKFIEGIRKECIAYTMRYVDKYVLSEQMIARSL